MRILTSVNFLVDQKNKELINAFDVDVKVKNFRILFFNDKLC